MDSMLYEKHLSFVYGLKDFDSVSDDTFIEAFKLLLKCLPNNGKLYKYRSTDDVSFKLSLDSLIDNYLWLSNVNEFNDELDAVINIDYEECSKNIIKYLIKHKNIVLKAFLKQEREKPNNKFLTLSYFHNDVVATAVDYMDEEGHIDRFGLKQALINKVEQYDDTLLEVVISLANEALKALSNRYYKYLTSAGINIMKGLTEYRDNLRIFCMCEKYDLDNMWANYSNNNGFAIEYDFNKLLTQDISAIKKCISMYKVRYSDNGEKYDFYNSFIDTLEGRDDSEYSKERDVIYQLTTKNNCWSNEQEWRIILANVDNKLYADLVSTIYIDSSFLKDEKSQKLIALAKTRKWNIYLRKLNINKRLYEYTLLKNN